MTCEYQQYLAHYGIKGQKHGVRRFQNEDGTLTPEGRQRYGINEDGTLTRAGMRRHGIVYGSQMNNIAKTMKRGNLTPERKEALKKEYDSLLNRSEAMRTRRNLVKAGMAVGAAHLLTGGRSTKIIAKAGLKTLRAIHDAAVKARNSKAFINFMKSKKYRNMGAFVAKKGTYSVGWRRLTAG